MAIKFVDSAASGANDGTSWADAWTSIASSTGVAAGDTVLVDDGHSQTGTIGVLTWINGTAANPVRIACVDKADDSPSSGAQVTCNSGSLTIQGFVAGEGLVWRQTASAVLNVNNTTATQVWRNCSFIHTGASSAGVTLSNGSRAVTYCHGCTLDLSGITADTQAVSGPTGNGAFVFWSGGSVIARSAGTQTSLFSLTAGGGMTFEGVSVVNAVTNLVNIATSAGGFFLARHCVLPAFTNLVTVALTAPELFQWAMLESCKTGTVSAPELGLTWRENRVGTVKSTLAKYRTGGADDPSGAQANPHSWEMVSNANVLEQVSWLESPPLARWVDAGASQTVTLYVATDGVTLQDDEFWVEVLSPSEAGTPTAQGRHQSTRLALRGTPADLTADAASAWTFVSGTPTKQKVTVAISPTVAGPVIVRACLAKASTTVYIDPKLEVA